MRTVSSTRVADRVSCAGPARTVTASGRPALSITRCRQRGLARQTAELRTFGKQPMMEAPSRPQPGPRTTPEEVLLDGRRSRSFPP